MNKMISERNRKLAEKVIRGLNPEIWKVTMRRRRKKRLRLHLR